MTCAALTLNLPFNPHHTCTLSILNLPHNAYHILRWRDLIRVKEGKHYRLKIDELERSLEARLNLIEQDRHAKFLADVEKGMKGTRERMHDSMKENQKKLLLAKVFDAEGKLNDIDQGNGEVHAAEESAQPQPPNMSSISSPHRRH